MHQKRSARLSTGRKFIGPTLAAFAPVLTMVTIQAVACYPGCALWTPDDPQWYVFFCYLCGA